MRIFMIKIIALVFLPVCACLSNLYAQEISGQGWTASEPRQRSASAAFMIAAGSAYDPLRSSSGTLVPAVAEHENGEEIRPPFPVLTPKVIIYPRKAIRKGWEGETVVAVEVLPDGSVGRTALAKSSGHEILDEAAENSIKTWKFGVESGNDEKAPQYVDIPVTFKLQSEE